MNSFMTHPCCVETSRSGIPLPNPHPSESTDRHTENRGQRLPNKRDCAHGSAETKPQVNFLYCFIVLLSIIRKL